MRGARIPWLLGIAVVVVLVGLGAVMASAEVVERGDLLPWGGDDIKRVQLLGGLEVYLSSESELPTRDLVTSSFLLVVASVCAFAGWLLLVVGGARGREAWFFPVAAAGALYLALDEYLAVHESIGHNLGFLADIPGVERPDDVVFALFLVPAVVFLWVFRRLILSSRAALWCFAAGALLTLGASAVDVAGRAPAVEDSAELVAAAVLAAGFVVLAIEVVGRRLVRPADAPGV